MKAFLWIGCVLLLGGQAAAQKPLVEVKVDQLAWNDPPEVVRRKLTQMGVDPRSIRVPHQDGKSFDEGYVGKFVGFPANFILYYNPQQKLQMFAFTFSVYGADDVCNKYNKILAHLTKKHGKPGYLSQNISPPFTKSTPCIDIARHLEDQVNGDGLSSDGSFQPLYQKYSWVKASTPDRAHLLIYTDFLLELKVLFMGPAWKEESARRNALPTGR